MAHLQEKCCFVYNIVEQANDGIVIAQDSVFKYVNPKFAEMLGYSVDELLETSIQSCIHPDAVALVLERQRQRLATPDACPSVYENVLKHKNGRDIHVEVNARVIPYQGLPAFLAVFRDISARKQTEEALQASEEQYRTLVNSIPDFIYCLDREGRHTAVNQSVCQALGLEAHDIIGKNHYELGFPDKIIRQWKKLNRQVFIKGTVVKAETQTPMPDGAIHTYEIVLIPVFNKKGIVTSIQGISRDITEGKKMLLALRESEEHFRQIVELLPVALFIHDGGEILFANTAAFKLIDMDEPQSLLNKPIKNFLHHKHKKAFTQTFQQVLSKKVNTKTFITKFVSTLGTTVDVELILSPFTYQDNPAVQIVAFDISKIKKMEEDMSIADKLESIGILAGGIAHDFNNYLATLLGNISLAKLYINSPERIYEKLDNMEKASLRAKYLTQQFFTFAKGGTPVRELMRIDNIITDSINFALSGSNVRCQLSLAEDLQAVEIDKGQIGQVLDNIIINAIQAMPHGGNIWVKAENIYINNEHLYNEHIMPTPEGNYVSISITDEGMGIPEQLKQKIFDPFFTTKPRGSGLGLATAYSIIKNHQGTIKVESEVGVGTTFHIFLPSSCKPVPTSTAEDSIIYGTGKILVMDDDGELRRTMGEMLSTLGYEVHFAEDGSRTVALYRNAKKTNRPFDLVVMDLTIPGGMGGKHTLKKLLKSDPAAKAIVISGYHDDPAISNFKKYGFISAMRKPFSLKELSIVMDQAINLSGRQK
ncbi:MAG: PAS domain S-box protein [Bacillota bacterium]